PDGEVVELGRNDIGHIYRLCHWLDELHSSSSAKDISRAKRSRCVVGFKIWSSICTAGLSSILCTTFNLIILPTFPV
ncbi:hypothetical protein V1523DRAFT_408297, partial [Lipomyces doorenjongii]